jgi:hypothetical protein
MTYVLINKKNHDVFGKNRVIDAQTKNYDVVA